MKTEEKIKLQMGKEGECITASAAADTNIPKGDSRESKKRKSTGKGVEQGIEYVRFIKTIKRFEADSSGDIDYEEAIEYFRRYQILHIRTFNSHNGSTTGKDVISFGPAQLHEMLERFSDVLKVNYNVENVIGREDVRIDQVFAEKKEERREGSWYASSILQATEKGSSTAKEIDNFVSSKLPICRPRLFDHIEAKQSAPMWLFIGQHIPNTENTEHVEFPYVHELRGRKEHTDSISTSGTWHYQCCGMYIISVFPQNSFFT